MNYTQYLKGNYICVRYKDNKIEFMTPTKKWTELLEEALLVDRRKASDAYLDSKGTVDPSLLDGVVGTFDLSIKEILKKGNNLYVSLERYLKEINDNLLLSLKKDKFEIINSKKNPMEGREVL